MSEWFQSKNSSQAAHPIVVIVASKRVDGEERFAPQLMTTLAGVGDDVQTVFALRCSTAANFFFKPGACEKKNLCDSNKFCVCF